MQKYRDNNYTEFGVGISVSNRDHDIVTVVPWKYFKRIVLYRLPVQNKVL